MAAVTEVYFFKLPLSCDQPPNPSPEDYVDSYNAKKHIILPHHPENWIKIGADKLCKWALAKQELTPTRITSYESLIRAIKIYNPYLENRSFNVLLSVLPSIFQNLDEGLTLIHQIISLAFRLKTLITTDSHIETRRESHCAS